METELTQDDIAELLAKRARKRRSKVNLCEDCGEPTPNEGYCGNCELRHQLVYGDR